MRKKSILTECSALKQPKHSAFKMKYMLHISKASLVKFVLAFMLAAVLLLGLAFTIINLSARRYMLSIESVPLAHTAIVLGAAIMEDGTPTQIFKDRINTAAALYKAGKVKNILITGDDGSRSHNEVNPAREYLLTKGVSSEDIFLDHAGFDTYSSMYRAKEVFYVGSAIICTQSFHLPRSIYIARRLGIDAYGVASDQHEYFFRNNVREVLADVKALFNLIIAREPKYLGEPIPITGDSSPSV